MKVISLQEATVGALYERALFVESTKYARSQTAPTVLTSLENAFATENLWHSARRLYGSGTKSHRPESVSKEGWKDEETPTEAVA